MEIITKTTTIPADLETPVGIYLKLRDLYPQSALLESSDYHTQQNSVSLIGVEPIGYFMLRDEAITARYPDGSEIAIEVGEQSDVPSALATYMKAFRFKDEMAAGNGLLGYTAYDAVRYFDKVYITKPCDEFRDIPEIYYILYRFIIRVNHFNNEMTIIENLLPGQESRTEEIKAIIHNHNMAQYSFTPCGEVTSTITDDDYKRMVEKGIAHARRGDVFQIVLSRRFAQEFRGDEFNVYRALRCVNPSPYLFFLTSSTCHPKIIREERCDALMPFHEHSP